MPPKLVEPMAALRFNADRYCPTLDEAILCDFITEVAAADEDGVEVVALDRFTSARRDIRGLLLWIRRHP